MKKILIAHKYLYKFLTLTLSILCISLYNSCETYFDSEPTTVIWEEGNIINESDFAFAVFPETETPNFFVTSEKQLLATIDEDLDGELDGIYLQTGDNDILIKCDETSKLPQLLDASTGERILFYFNEDLTLVTLSYFPSDGSSETTENIEINPADFVFDDQSTGKKVNDDDKVKDQVQLAARMTGFLASSVGCLISASSITFTFGLSSVAAALTCTNAAFGLVNTVVSIANVAGAQINTNAINLVSNGLLLSDAFFCGLGDVGACVTGTLGLTDLLFSGREEERTRSFAIPPEGWYKGTYTLGFYGNPNNIYYFCFNELLLGRKGDFYFYIGDNTNQNQIVAYMKSIVPNVPNIYTQPTFAFSNSDNEFYAFSFNWKNGGDVLLTNNIEYIRFLLGSFQYYGSTNSIRPYTSLSYTFLGQRIFLPHSGEISYVNNTVLIDDTSCGDENVRVRYGLTDMEAEYLGTTPPESLSSIQLERIYSLLGTSTGSFILEE